MRSQAQAPLAVADISAAEGAFLSLHSLPHKQPSGNLSKGGRARRHRERVTDEERLSLRMQVSGVERSGVERIGLE